MAKRNVGRPKNSDISYSDRKLEVLQCAAQQFNERGYHNTTMDDIAAALGVTKPALYYYAKSKDEVLFQVNEHAVTTAQAAVLKLKDEGSNGAEKLRVFFGAWAEHVCSDFGRCLIQTKPNNLEPKTQRRNTKARRELQDEVVSVLEEGMQDGSIRPCDAKLMAIALFDLFNGIAYWLDPKGKYSVEQLTSIYWETLVSGLITPGRR